MARFNVECGIQEFIDRTVPDIFDNRLFDLYDQVPLFEKLTMVKILDDDYGYYLVDEVNKEILNITFKNSSEARKHAVCEYLVISL